MAWSRRLYRRGGTDAFQAHGARRRDTERLVSVKYIGTGYQIYRCFRSRFKLDGSSRQELYIDNPPSDISPQRLPLKASRNVLNRRHCTLNNIPGAGEGLSSGACYNIIAALLSSVGRRHHLAVLFRDNHRHFSFFRQLRMVWR